MISDLDDAILGDLRTLPTLCLIYALITNNSLRLSFRFFLWVFYVYLLFSFSLYYCYRYHDQFLFLFLPFLWIFKHKKVLIASISNIFPVISLGNRPTAANLDITGISPIILESSGFSPIRVCISSVFHFHFLLMSFLSACCPSVFPSFHHLLQHLPFHWILSFARKFTSSLRRKPLEFFYLSKA